MIASTSGSAAAERTLAIATSQVIAAKLATSGSSAKQAAFAAHEKATIARCIPVRSAIHPQAAGATMRASCGKASSHAISAAPSPRAAR